MSTIPANFFVNVQPNVLSAGGDALDLIGLVLTASTRVPIGTVKSFPSADAVTSFFGGGSAESIIAEGGAGLGAGYFGGFTNSNKLPGSILFAQYNATAVSAYLRGASVAALTIAQLQAITGSLTVVFDGYSYPAASINLSAAASFSAAAATIQTGLNGSKPTQASGTFAITGTTLTVSGSITGAFAVGQTLVAAGIAANTRITAFIGGTGGAGTYMVNNSQTLGSIAGTAVGTDVVVSYDSVSGAFVVTSGITGTISSASFATGTISAALKLTSATGATLSQGAAAATPGTFMDGVIDITQNWASFFTAFDPDVSGNTNKLAFAAWTNAQNNRYAYICWDTDVTPTLAVPATGSLGYLIEQANYSGTSPVWEPSDLNYAAFISGAIASIDFEQTDGRTTFAYLSQGGLVASVTGVEEAANLGGSPLVAGDFGNGYNWYGATATANEDFVWLQRGTISGPFQWLDSYINQIWLNNAFQLALMELLKNAKSIPYNALGNSMIEAALQDPIDAGLNFGAFRPGVTLSASQAQQVNTAAGAVIAPTLQARGWYLQVKAATPQVRQNRGSPPMTFWYMDGQSVQAMNLASILVQ